MPKPDFALRTRPLQEVEDAIKQLRNVILFHPDKISTLLTSIYCVCRRRADHFGANNKGMIQCTKCFEWFHIECIAEEDIPEEGDEKHNCEYCRRDTDVEGYQRWYSDRKNPKKRHLNDRPISNGVQLGQDLPPRYSSPKDWEGKVKETKEMSRRKAVKKRKLEEAAQNIVDAGGHHTVDMQGMNGLSARPVTDELVDELIQIGDVDPEQFND
jgi:hypothetical protein